MARTTRLGGTHCPRGHEYGGTNALAHGKSRECRECKNLRRRETRRDTRIRSQSINLGGYGEWRQETLVHLFMALGIRPGDDYRAAVEHAKQTKAGTEMDVLDKVSRAIFHADDMVTKPDFAWGDTTAASYRAMAQAAIDSLGLTEERQQVLPRSGVVLRPKTPYWSGAEQYTRLVSPWVRADGGESNV